MRLVPQFVRAGHMLTMTTRFVLPDFMSICSVQVGQSIDSCIKMAIFQKSLQQDLSLLSQVDILTIMENLSIVCNQHAPSVQCSLLYIFLYLFQRKPWTQPPLLLYKELWKQSHVWRQENSTECRELLQYQLNKPTEVRG